MLTERQNRRDGSVVENTVCFSRRPGFDSQHSHRSLPVPGDPLPSSSFQRHQVYSWCTDIHAGKIKVNRLKKKKKAWLIRATKQELENRVWPQSLKLSVSGHLQTHQHQLESQCHQAPPSGEYSWQFHLRLKFYSSSD